MSRKGENIYKRQDERWEARVLVGRWPNGKRKYHSVYGKTYQEAKKKKKEYLQGRPFLVERLPSEEESGDSYLSALPFRVCVEEWLEQQKEQVKPSTYTTYIRMIEAQLLPELGAIPLDRMNHRTMKEFLVKKRKHGRHDGKGGLSPKTIADMVIVLTSIFEYTYTEYRYPNPMKAIKKTAKAKKKIEPLNEKESKALTHYLLSNFNPETAGTLCSLHMGLRLGEVCALRWENIDLDNGVFKIRHTVYRILSEENSKKTELAISSPKTDSSIRDVPIPQFLISFLRGLACEPECYLVTGTTECIEPRTFQNHFKRTLQACGLRSIPYHCLRHTFATNCVILDFDVKTLSEILGHASTGITLDRYVHSSMHQKQRQMTKVSNSISSIL